MAEEAIRVQVEFSALDPTLMGVYKCQFCGWLHIGHTPYRYRRDPIGEGDQAAK